MTQKQRKRKIDYLDPDNAPLGDAIFDALVAAARQTKAEEAGLIEVATKAKEDFRDAVNKMKRFEESL